MLPPRVVLNVVYAMLTDGMDSQGREEFDAKLYGWDELNQQGNKALFDKRGGEDE